MAKITITEDWWAVIVGFIIFALVVAGIITKGMIPWTLPKEWLPW